MVQKSGEFNTLAATLKVLQKNSVAFTPEDVSALLSKGHQNICNTAQVLHAFRELAFRGFASMVGNDPRRYQYCGPCGDVFHAIFALPREKPYRPQTPMEITRQVQDQGWDFSSATVAHALELLTITGNFSCTADGKYSYVEGA